MKFKFFKDYKITLSFVLIGLISSFFLVHISYAKLKSSENQNNIKYIIIDAGHDT